MSRVEDDRDAARMAERLMEQRRTEESRKTDKANSANTFSKLVGKQQGEAKAGQQQAQTQKENTARGAIASLLEQAEAAVAQNAHEGERANQTHQQEAGFKGRLGAKDSEQKTLHNARSGSEHAQKTKLDSDQGQATANAGRSADQKSSAAGAESRKADAAAGRATLADRKESSESSKSSSTPSAGGARGEKGDLKTDADKGGGQQGGGSKDDKGGGAAAAGFRFNPALMAPVPVAKQKEASGSERLRKIANELAQKIVEKVRVGTNAQGKVEFQIDMRSDVLSGLSVKVSSHQGKIKAVFSGSDRDVLKMIEEQGEALKSALSARGLSLEEFKVEARA